MQEFHFLSVLKCLRRGQLIWIIGDWWMIGFWESELFSAQKRKFIVLEFNQIQSNDIIMHRDECLLRLEQERSSYWVEWFQVNLECIMDQVCANPFKRIFRSIQGKILTCDLCGRHVTQVMCRPGDLEPHLWKPSWVGANSVLFNTTSPSPFDRPKVLNIIFLPAIKLAAKHYPLKHILFALQPLTILGKLRGCEAAHFWNGFHRNQHFILGQGKSSVGHRRDEWNRSYDCESMCLSWRRSGVSNALTPYHSRVSWPTAPRSMYAGSRATQFL